MNISSMIVSPSIILLQPHVGRFHASDQAKISIFCRWSGNVVFKKALWNFRPVFLFNLLQWPIMTYFLVYYSIFIHYLLRLGQKYDGNIYIVLEALLKIPFIPSPSGWKKGIDMADESDLVQNFILCFIDEKRDNHGAVSSGTHTRRQVCHQKKVHITKIMASLHKLPSLIELANTNNDTTTVVKKFTDLYLVQYLGATELIHVLTKIGIITNNVHISIHL